MSVIDAAMEKINDAWKSASEEKYKDSQETQKDAGQAASDGPSDSDVTDVDFEEVKEEDKEKK